MYMDYTQHVLHEVYNTECGTKMYIIKVPYFISTMRVPNVMILYLYVKSYPIHRYVTRSLFSTHDDT